MQRVNALKFQSYPAMITGKVLSACLMIGLLICVDALAAEPKTGGDSAAIKKAQGLIRQLSQEKTALEAEKTTWLTEKTMLEAKVKSLEETVKKLQPLEAQVEQYKVNLEAAKSTLEAQLGQERQKEQALLQKHNDVVVKANAIHADNQLLVEAVKEREQWIEQCSANNKALRAATLEMLRKYQDKGLLQQLGEIEPFTGIGGIETETTVEDYKYKLHQLKITPFKAKEPEPESTATPEGAQGKQ